MTKHFVTSLCATVLSVSALGSSAFLCPQVQAATTRVSLSTSGTEGNSDSGASSLSANGLKVAFISNASNLVANDTNGEADVFVRDLTTGVTTRVSVNSNGNQANGPSFDVSLSGDGTTVSFESNASNLVAGDTNGVGDVFVHDLTTGITRRVSIDSNGNQAMSSDSSNVGVSADGKRVAFESNASNLVAGDTNGLGDVFIHDLTTGVTTRVSVNSNGDQADNASMNASLSADGKSVSFESQARNLVNGVTTTSVKIYVHNVTTGVTKLASVPINFTIAMSYNSSISGDGTRVAFQSFSSHLVTGDTNNAQDIFVHDLTTGVTKRVSVDSNGNQGNAPAHLSVISADGNRVAFESNASNLVAGDTNGLIDIFVHDLSTGVTKRVNVDENGDQINYYSYVSSLSADGNMVSFESASSDLVSGDTNGDSDVFVSDTLSPRTIAVNNPRTFSEGPSATGSGGSGSTTFTITLSAATFQTVTVNYKTTDNSAIAGSDYIARSGTLTFEPGETTKYVRVNFIGDKVAEANETFFLDLTTPVNATIADSRGIAYIGNDDGPNITISNARAVNEGHSQTTSQSFIVRLSAPSTDTITVDWMTANNTAGPADYVTASGRLTFAPGEIQKSITVQIKGDTTVEPTETYRVNLTRPTFATIGDSQGIGYILNDDSAPSLAISEQPSK